jgi:MFS family permease
MYRVQLRSKALVPTLVFVGLVVAAVGSLGAPLVPTVAAQAGVSLAAAQWTLTGTLLVGAVATPLLGRLGDGPHRRATVLGTLMIVLLGSVLTVVPFGFGVLLVGRCLQGVGLGLTSLVIAIARDAYPQRRSIVGLLSVTSVAGIGVGYPVAGVLTEYVSLRAAYGAGLLVVAAGLVLAVAVIPHSGHRESRPLDIAGAVLLGTGLTGLLFAIGQAGSGVRPTVLIGLLLGSLLVGAVWARHEMRTPYPLVDLRLLRLPAVLVADVTVLFGGVGMYLLLSLVTRYVQTPTATGYGSGASVVVAGLVLVPFSLLSFVASRIVAALSTRRPDLVLAGSCLVVLVASVTFALARDRLWESFVVMGVAGLGVGSIFAAVPAFIVRSVPANETGSAVGFNQVLRTVGFSAGSAVAGLVLAAATPAGQVFPVDRGYTVAALIGAAFLLVTAIVLVAVMAVIRRTDTVP